MSFRKHKLWAGESAQKPQTCIFSGDPPVGNHCFKRQCWAAAWCSDWCPFCYFCLIQTDIGGSNFIPFTVSKVQNKNWPQVFFWIISNVFKWKTKDTREPTDCVPICPDGETTLCCIVKVKISHCHTRTQKQITEEVGIDSACLSWCVFLSADTS